MNLTYRELILWLKETLNGRENLDHEVRWLIEAFSGREFLSIGADEAVPRVSVYRRAAERLKRHEPFQYVVGSQEFYGHLFLVNESVLVPRPETELLAEKAIRWGRGRRLKALDLCTGSGCIAISLAKELDGDFLATDISEAALATAKKNNELNGTDVTFRYSDLFFHLPKGERFDLITANPPYLTQKEMREIPLEVTHEPFIALDGGPTGLFAIERIMKEVADRLGEKGLFLMEIGENQGETALSLAAKYGLAGAVTERDLNGKDRFLRWEKA